MSEIVVEFHTNLDIHPGEKWPLDLPARPVVGDYVRSASNLELQVVAIRWKPSPLPGAWYLSAELHLPKDRYESIAAFHKWYKERHRG